MCRSASTKLSQCGINFKDIYFVIKNVQGVWLIKKGELEWLVRHVLKMGSRVDNCVSIKTILLSLDTDGHGLYNLVVPILLFTNRLLRTVCQ